jgi:thioredoxin 1
MGAVFEVTDATFEQEVLKSDTPVLVDFFTPWCGPCRMLAPVLEKLSEEFSGRVKLVKVDAGEQPRLSATYRVQAVPTLVIIKGGQVVESLMGLQAEEELRKRLAAVAEVK